jgi:hypothetical protein
MPELFFRNSIGKTLKYDETTLFRLEVYRRSLSVHVCIGVLITHTTWKTGNQ